MNRYVLDASAVLRLTDKEPGFRRVRDLLKLGEKHQAKLLIGAVNWAELLIVLRKRAFKKPEFDWQEAAEGFANVPLKIVAVDAYLAEVAAEFRTRFQLPLADSFAAALAHSESQFAGKPVPLVTADFDFKAIPSGTISIEFLPAK